MGVTLERVQSKFACIIGELCSEPDILSQFAIWLDLRLAEYKLKGSIVLDCSGLQPEPTWLRGYHGKQRRKQARPRAITPQTAPDPILEQYEQTVMEEWYVEENEFGPAELETSGSLGIPISNDHQNDVVVKKEIIDDELEEKNAFPFHVYRHKPQKRRALETSLDLETSSSKVPHFSESVESTVFNEHLRTAFRSESCTNSDDFKGRDTPLITAAFQPELCIDSDSFKGRDTTLITTVDNAESCTDTDNLKGRETTHFENELNSSICTTPNMSLLDRSLDDSDNTFNIGTEIQVKHDRRNRDLVLMTSTSVQTSADKIVTGRLAVPQVCEDCGLVYNRSDSYRRHRRIHHQQGKRHVCDVCGKLFTRNEHLQRHLKSHAFQ